MNAQRVDGATGIIKEQSYSYFVLLADYRGYISTLKLRQIIAQGARQKVQESSEAVDDVLEIESIQLRDRTAILVTARDLSDKCKGDLPLILSLKFTGW